MPRMVQVTKFLTVLIFVTLLSAVVVADGIQGEQAPEILIDQWLTDNPPDVDGLSGRVYVVEFWATWCPPCVKITPDLIDFYKEYSARGVSFISLAQEKDAHKVRQFIAREGINYPVALDNGTAGWFSVEYYPTAAVVDHTGTVIWQGNPQSNDLEKAVEKALKRAPQSLLAGLEMGPFAYLREPLYGGRDFQKAYRLIASASANRSDKTADLAAGIISTIDSRINDKLRKADSLRRRHPDLARRIYRRLISKYAGISRVEQARANYRSLLSGSD